MAVCVLGAIDNHPKAAVDDLAPANSAAVVDGYPGGAAEAVADDILDGHIGTEAAAVVDVGGFAEGGVRAGDVVVVAAKDDGSRYFAFTDGLVESQSYLGAAFAIGIEDAGLGADDEVVPAGFLYPVDVVTHLAGDFRGGCGGHF